MSDIWVTRSIWLHMGLQIAVGRYSLVHCYPKMFMRYPKRMDMFERTVLNIREFLGWSNGPRIWFVDSFNSRFIHIHGPQHNTSVRLEFQQLFKIVVKCTFVCVILFMSWNKCNGISIQLNAFCAEFIFTSFFFHLKQIWCSERLKFLTVH